MGDVFFGSSDTSVQQLPLLTKAQRQLLNSLSNVLKGQVGQGVEPYGGALAPEATSLQRKWWDLMGSEIGGPGFQAMQATLMDTMRKFDPTSTKAWWEEAIKAPAIQTWEQDVIPGIMEQFASMDATDSGAARRAVAESGRNLTSDLGATLANTLFSAEQAHKANQLRAAGMESTLPGYLNALSPAAASQYGVETALLQDPYMKWQMSRPYNNPWLLNYLVPTLGTRAFENVVTQSSQPGIFGPLLQAGATLGGAYLMSPYKLW